MVDGTFNLIAATEVDGPQLRQGLEALEVACGRRARVRGRVSAWTIFPERSVVALRQQPTDPDHSQHNPLTWALGGFTGDFHWMKTVSTHVNLLEIRQALEHGNVTCRVRRSRG